MPTYEYACRDCDTRLEVVQSFTDDPLETCEVCGGSLRKVFSAAGIIFKGSGYYVTDTRGDRGRSSSTKSESSSTDSSSSDGSKSSSSNGSSGTKDSSSTSESKSTPSTSDAKSA